MGLKKGYEGAGRKGFEEISGHRNYSGIGVNMTQANSSSSNRHNVIGVVAAVAVAAAVVV